jgi:hypothetical protein
VCRVVLRSVFTQDRKTRKKGRDTEEAANATDSNDSGSSVTDEDEKSASVASSAQLEEDVIIAGDDDFVSDAKSESDHAGADVDVDAEGSDGSNLPDTESEDIPGKSFFDAKILAMSRKSASAWVTDFAGILKAFAKVAATSPSEPHTRRASLVFVFTSLDSLVTIQT